MTIQGMFARQGAGWRLAGSLVTLADEISVAYPSATCLGTVGDAAHAAEHTSSDHNPFILGPGGVGIVRAIDIGGPPDVQQALFDHIQAMYEAHDPRLFQFGYVHKDNVITSWPGPGTHRDDGDVGHLHVSVTQANGNSPSPSGYLAAIDSTASWGLGNAPAAVHPSPAAAGGAPPWPSIIPRGEFFGLASGPAESHGGGLPAEIPFVELIQAQLNRHGFGPVAVDGTFGPATEAAVTKFQRANMPGTQFFGQVWTDDWAKLFSL